MSSKLEPNESQEGAHQAVRGRLGLIPDDMKGSLGTMRGPPLRQVIWKSLRPPGAEYCAVRQESGGWSFRGAVVRTFKEGTAGIHYAIRVDPRWRTKEVFIEQLLDGARTSVQLEASRGRWRVNGNQRRNLSGCTDVDLEASPLTNTFPIRRSRLHVGSKVECKVAWVRFPSLKVQPYEQSYERLGQSRYRYLSSSGFKSELELDSFGLVSRYGDFWAAV